MGSQSKLPRADAATRRILQSLRAVVRDLRLASTSCEKRFGLSAAQLFVLQVLQEEPGLSLGEVAERTGTDQSSVSVVVRKLQEKQLVKKQASAEDARRLVIHPTAAGTRLAQSAPPAVQGQLIQRLAGLGARERAQLADLLERFAPADAEAQPMFFEESAAAGKEGKARE